jgi:uncharacterized PurR-regulated membrane protein YhhQ (DUF165 family)|tara:strand:+ start:3329 stop:3934 length:606 start_codon:yes stop_codon:yes gene_type:complete
MKNFSKLTLSLVALHIFIIGISNYLVQFPIIILGYEFTIATFTFPFIILATDLTVRIYKEQVARKIIIGAFVPAFFISLYFADFRIAIASVSAYALGQFLDIFIFSKLRSKISPSEHLSLNKNWYIAPAVSTLFAQIIDTYVFYGLAFYNSADEFMREHWVPIATNDLLFKLLICYLAFLPIYGIILNLILLSLRKKTSIN